MNDEYRNTGNMDTVSMLGQLRLQPVSSPAGPTSFVGEGVEAARHALGLQLTRYIVSRVFEPYRRTSTGDSGVLDVEDVESDLRYRLKSSLVTWLGGLALVPGDGASQEAHIGYQVHGDSLRCVHVAFARPWP